MDIFKKTKEYLAGVAAEGKRVSCPAKRELWESTLVVISFIFILAVTTLICDEVIKSFLHIVHAGA